MNDAYKSLPKVRSTTLTHLKIRKTYFVLGHYWWRTHHPPSLELRPFMKKICCNYLNIWETLEDAKVQDFQVSAKWKHTKKSQGFVPSLHMLTPGWRYSKYWALLSMLKVQRPMNNWHTNDLLTHEPASHELDQLLSQSTFSPQGGSQDLANHLVILYKTCALFK